MMTITTGVRTRLSRAYARIAELETRTYSMELLALLRKLAEQTADLRELETTLHLVETTVGGEHMLTQYHPAFREYSAVRRRWDALQAAIVQTGIELADQAKKDGVLDATDV